MDDRNDNRPPGKSSPWRQPIVWLVIALPAAVVVAGIAMLVVAGRDGSSDTVTSEVHRTAQIQTADLGPDALARNEKLSAIVRIDAEHELVEVLPVSGRFERNARLRLALQHPARASEDQTLLLEPGVLGWRTEARVEGGHDWKLQLGPEDGRWRLQGRLPKGQQAAHLRPALQAP